MSASIGYMNILSNYASSTMLEFGNVTQVKKNDLIISSLLLSRGGLPLAIFKPISRAFSLFHCVFITLN